MYRVTVEWPLFGGQSVYMLDASWVEIDPSISSINYEVNNSHEQILIESMSNARIIIEKLTL